MSEKIPQRYWQNWDKGKAAEKIDEYWRESEAGWRKVLARNVRSELGTNVELTEVGCGTGLIYEALRHQGVVTPSSYQGGDISQNMLAIARQRFSQVRFRELDIYKLDLPTYSQPNVINIHVLQHLPHYEDAVRELLRVARDRLYIACWFNHTLKDELVFSQPSDRWDGQAFQNNRYSLPKFLKFLLSQNDRQIRDLHVHGFDDHNHAITICFGSPSNKAFETPMERKLRNRIKKSWRKITGKNH